MGEMHGVGTEGNPGETTEREWFVTKDSYLLPEYAKLEKERLWPRVWQIACREEELPRVGSYVTFEVAGESILVIRTSKDVGGINAFYNVCQHRGRKLLEGCGETNNIYCRYHGWRWSLEGKIEHIQDREDWEGGLKDEELHLKKPLVDTWGGFVWINMDNAAEPLHDYLQPALGFLDPYEFEKMRYRWSKSFVLNCNWKVALEGFNEGYHVAATHPQLLPYFDDMTRAVVHGKHAMFHYNESKPYGQPSRRLNRPPLDDTRESVFKYMTMMDRELNAIISDNMAKIAAPRLIKDLPPGTKDYDTLMGLMQFTAEADIATGAGWPTITAEQMAGAGTDWHLFPNAITLMLPDGAIWYRARPYGDDPDYCQFDVMSLQRFPPGQEPKVEREFYQDWRDCKQLGQILTQDFSNFEQVQAGMKSRGFVGSLTNPKQETPVSNYHRVLHEYLGRPVG
ncbi:MAG: SRPBCC family protein [Pseudoxanthomonas sp.]